MLSVVMLSVVMLSVVKLSVVMLSVVMLSAVMLSVVMLSVVMLSFVILSFVILSVVALSVISPCNRTNDINLHFTSVTYARKVFIKLVRGENLKNPKIVINNEKSRQEDIFDLR
jgi:hypothetical protein